ncbi:MAG: heme-binding protein [Phycisphaerales bacterium]|nr:heme-binding protein [Phycisphaerales bacterium]
MITRALVPLVVLISGAALCAQPAAPAGKPHSPAAHPSSEGSEGPRRVRDGSLTLAGAEHILQASSEYSAARAGTGSIAVVDAGGHLLALRRLDGTFPASAHVAEGKARTAAEFRKPTRDFESAINSGRTAMAAMKDWTPLQGGVPVFVDGACVGAVGVSGAASAQQDDEIAQAGARAVSDSSPHR